jgi:hypothetical protein
MPVWLVASSLYITDHLQRFELAEAAPVGDNSAESRATSEAKQVKSLYRII